MGKSSSSESESGFKVDLQTIWATLDRGRLFAVGLMSLVLIAFILIAATFEQGELVVQPAGTLPDLDPSIDGENPTPFSCPPYLSNWRIFTVSAALLGAALALGMWKGVTTQSMAILGASVIIAWGLLCDPLPAYDVSLGFGSSGQIGVLPIEDMLMGLLILNILTFVVIGIIWFSQRPAPAVAGPQPTADTDTRESELESIRATAGEVADQIEADEEAIGNLVYHAWRVMADMVQVSGPRSSTPGEFADAAIQMGMKPTHVEELTQLFEDVRYGEEDPKKREQRALEILRRIENASRTEDRDS